MALIISIIGPSYVNLLGFTNINGERSRKKMNTQKRFWAFPLLNQSFDIITFSFTSVLSYFKFIGTAYG
jgi:hypothetical protein